MDKKIIYIVNPFRRYSIGGGVCGAFNVIELFENALVSKGFEVMNKRGTKLCLKSMALCDFVVISGTSIDLKKIYDLCRALNKKYIFFPFYEEEEWIVFAMHFFYNASFSQSNKFFGPSNDMLIKHYHWQQAVKVLRRSVFEDSLFSVVNSNQESYGVLKECASVVVCKCRLSCGIVKDFNYPNTDQFLEITGLKKGEYIVQIGRLNLRKNQIASVLGTRNLNYPMIFIFNEYSPEYLKVLIESIESSNRKQMIYFITDIKGMCFGDKVRVIETKLDDQLLISAYQNAGLHLHPAFYECPGYTYLEAAKLGVATVGSSWSTISEYLSDAEGEFGFHEGFEFVRPDDIEGIEACAKKMFGKKFTRPDLPIFNRKSVDVQRDMGVLIDRYML